MHALVIEDEPVIALAVQTDLKELGIAEITIAGSVSEAIRCAEKRSPDLLIADYRLLDGTGVQAVRTIDAPGRIPTVYACALSVEVLREVPDAIIVTKPFSFDELRIAVAKARLYARVVG